MRNLNFYLRILTNFVRYKFVFKASQKFLIDFGAEIVGGNMIVLGQSFAAKKNLRMEAFGPGTHAKIIIGDFVSLGTNVHIGALNKIVIGQHVLFGSNILVTDHNHGKYNGDYQCSPHTSPSSRVLHSPGPVIINDNVWIGDGAVILANVEVGKGAVIAANTVVNKDVPAHTIVAGNPMRKIKQFNFETSKWEAS